MTDPLIFVGLTHIPIKDAANRSHLSTEHLWIAHGVSQRAEAPSNIARFRIAGNRARVFPIAVWRPFRRQLALPLTTRQPNSCPHR